MMFSIPALTTSLPGKAHKGGGAAREDPRLEVKMGIARDCISRLICGARS